MKQKSNHAIQKNAASISLKHILQYYIHFVFSCPIQHFKVPQSNPRGMIFKGGNIIPNNWDGLAATLCLKVIKYVWLLKENSTSYVLCIYT